MKALRRLPAILLVVVGVLLLVQAIASRPTGDVATPHRLPVRAQVEPAVVRVNRLIEKEARAEGVVAVDLAAEPSVLRRLSLALHGTVPSLEEWRQFEQDPRENRLGRWTERMLRDDRFADYFAERLARGLVGSDEGAFLAFRRDRLNDWLAEQLKADRPWDRITYDLVTATGLPTGEPATNFITAALVNDEIDEEKLAGRTVRAFIGQRLDCAQCHDHFLDERWTQAHFQGLAAFFAGTRSTPLGVEDQADREYLFTMHDEETEKVVAPAVPFGEQWLPSQGPRRRRLAAWLTHSENRRFDRAIVSRVWTLLFGRPYDPEIPVDDLPDPGDPRTRVFDVLAEDFRVHKRSLRRLIHVITGSRPFRLGSQPGDVSPEMQKQLEKNWCVFPLVRLRPEQVIGSMLQAASIKTIDRNSHLFVRLFRFFREQGFVQEYGDLGDAELVEYVGTISQALLRMNGELGHELGQTNGFTAASRISQVTLGNDPRCLDTCYLVCLGRKPTAEEAAVFLELLKDTTGGKRKRIVEDIFWALFNSMEFSWNH